MKTKPPSFPAAMLKAFVGCIYVLVAMAAATSEVFHVVYRTGFVSSDPLAVENVLLGFGHALTAALLFCSVILVSVRMNSILDESIGV